MALPALELTLAGVLGLCFIGSAALSAAEVSIIRVRRSSVLARAEAGTARASRLLSLLDDLPVVLNTILLLALGLQVAAATTAGMLADRWFGRAGVTATSVALTAVLFVYAEAIPKTRAIRSPEDTAMRMTPALRIIVSVLRPVVSALVRFASLHLRGSVTVQSALTEEEIVALAAESADAGTIGHGDAEMVVRSFEFNDRRVGDVMVPRDRMATVGAEAEAGDVLRLAVELGHRRLPVLTDDLDHIVGVVRLRDVAAEVNADRSTPAAALVSPVVRSGPDEPISILLRRMQGAGCWVAIVHDADGATIGLATVEDLVAELVGEIDDDQPTASHRTDGTEG